MSYTALYRKFRPNDFSEVKGQDHIVKTLSNQIKLGRIGHAYLFTGTRGTGKTSIAKIMAKAVNCENPTEKGPCNECAMCKAITSQSSMNVIEMDAASNNGVENIREIVEAVQYSPAEGKYKVYIIDEVHMLSVGAFNALLKTLEEPPSYVIFILATTEVHKIPITILSRCQRYDFHRISIDTVAEQLKHLTDVENVEAEEKALRYIAKTADGSMRDGLSLLDQCIAFYLGEKLTYDKVLEVLGAVDTDVFYRLLTSVIEGDVKSSIGIIEEIVINGRELTWFINEFTWYLRNLLLVSTSADDCEDMIEMSSDNLKLLKEQSERISADTLVRYIRILSELSGTLKYANQKRVLTEIGIIKLCKPEMESDISSIKDRIRRIELQLQSGKYVSVESASAQNIEVQHNNPINEVKEEEVILPSALTEDARLVAENWSDIIENLELPLQNAVRKMQLSVSDSVEGALMLVSSNPALTMIMENQDSYKALCECVNNYVKKDVKIIVKRIDKESESRGLYPDLERLVKNGIPVDFS